MTACQVLATAGESGLAYQAPAQDPTTIVPEALQRNGRKIDGGRAVLWFMEDDVPVAEAKRLTELISRGIDDIEALLGLSFGPDRELEFFVTPAFGVTSVYHAPSARVFLSLARVQNRQAPFVHESVHHLIFSRATDRTKEVHNWVLEGFANYVQAAVAGGVATDLLRHPMVFPNESVDREAHTLLKTPLGREVVSFVGRPGYPGQPPADPTTFQRTFYALSQSLAKHLIDSVGVRRFASSAVECLLHAARFERAVYDLTGKSLEQVRREWLDKIDECGDPADDRREQDSVAVGR